MIERLKEIEKRFCDVETELNSSDVVRDKDRYRDLMKEYKNLTPIIEKYRELKSAEDDVAAAEEMLESETDPEFRRACKEEAEAQRERCAALEAEIKVLLLPRDENDEKSVIMEIRAGAGGEEAALFAHSLFRMYSMYAAAQRWKIGVMDINETELGGIKEISFSVEGQNVYSRLKYESGVHRVQRVPETEASGRIHTSTVTVAVLPEVEDVEIEIKDSDIEVETCKSSGAGGQHVNKTESAIRILHKPTGIVVWCQEERSQFQNKEKAMNMLRAKLYDIEQQKQQNEITSTRRSQIGTGDRSEKIRTYNFPQSRVTDHRIGASLYSLEAFMNGDIGGMIDLLTEADIAAKLSAQDKDE